jgi:SAM-dependent methyltransferase
VSSFDAVAASLREEITRHWQLVGEPLDTTAQRMTLDVNSSLVEHRAEPLAQVLARRLGTPKLHGVDLVDLGCGFGAMSLYFAHLGARVVGIDPHGVRLDLARRVAAEHGLDARFAQGRMEALSLPDRRFDAAVENNSLCYVVGGEARALALRETLRVLRPCGWLVMRNPNLTTPVDQFTGLPLVHLLPRPARERVLSRLGRERSDVVLTTVAGARRELRQAGFVDVAQVLAGDGMRQFLRPLVRYHHFAARRPATERR